MKQQITYEQFMELGEKERSGLIDYICGEDQWLSLVKGRHTQNYMEKCAYQLFTIGRMIGWLDLVNLTDSYEYEGGRLSLPYQVNDLNNGIELCDALWERVKDKIKLNTKYL